jgi:hypothetical protein
VSAAPDPFGPGYRDFLAARTRFLAARGAEAEIRRLERAWTADEHRATHGGQQDADVDPVVRRERGDSQGESERAAARSGAVG